MSNKSKFYFTKKQIKSCRSRMEGQKFNNYSCSIAALKRKADEHAKTVKGTRKR